MLILDDAKQGKLRCQSRSLNRMMPILASCRAELDKIGDCVLKAIDVYLSTDNVSLPTEISYKSMVKVRNNTGKELSQKTIIGIIGQTISGHYPQWRVNLTDPYLYISVDVVKTVCCVSVIHGYTEYKKFNLHELVANYHTAQAIASDDSRVKGEKTTDSSGKSTECVPQIVEQEGGKPQADPCSGENEPQSVTTSDAERAISDDTNVFKAESDVVTPESAVDT